MNTSPNARLRTAQVISAAMVAGLAVFTGLAVALAGRIEAQLLDERLITALLAALGLFILVVAGGYVAVRRRALNRLREALVGKSITPEIQGQLAHLYFTMLVILVAILEGWGLLGALVHMFTGAWPALVAPVAALVAILLQFPSQDRLGYFVSDLTGQSGP